VNPKDIYKQVGKNIRRYREGAHQTQAQLAPQIGISRASLANIEAGRQQVLVHYLYAIADALDLDSPTSLLATLPAPTPHDIEPYTTLPLPEEGLTDKQRREVLRLMGGVLNDRNHDDVREEK
jgi:transcriptional regulator with XRE-family HTH domain